MIVKDEAASITGTINSVKGSVDRYCILDTGSKDDTINLIQRAFQGIPGKVYQEPFVDFSTTRNRVLELAGKECQYTLMLSGDEYLHNGDKIVDYLKNLKNPIGGLEVKVKYGQTAYNSIRICNTDYQWTYVGVTHEYVMSKTPGTRTVIYPFNNDKDPFILHDLSTFNLTSKRKRWQLDRDLLLADLEKDPTNTRTVFYLAQSFDCLDDLVNAYKYYHLRFEMGGWIEERYEALSRMAGLMERMGYAWGMAEEKHLQAFEFFPKRAESLYRIAKHWYDEKQYEVAFLFASRAYQIPFPTQVRLFINPDIYSFYIPELLSHICTHLKEHTDIGLEATEKCLQRYPANTQLRNNQRIFQNRLQAPSYKTLAHVSLSVLPNPL
ncbi:hypothetical protein WA171_005328, partial [Blastocystis sp. BT1]